MDLSTMPLRFLWLEVTNRCNEQCTHCYNDSGPHRSAAGEMSVAQWKAVLVSASRLGCSAVQFIGGEPTLLPGLPELLDFAFAHNFRQIEVFTNATRLNERLIRVLVQTKANIATSLYGATSETHDRITGLAGSFQRTMSSLENLISAGVPVRVGYIGIDENVDEFSAAEQCLSQKGITNFGFDRARAFGRLHQLASDDSRAMNELCGHCWNGSACVLPDGSVCPCIMSRRWVVGNVQQTDLCEIVASQRLAAVRQMIYEETANKRELSAQQCHPNNPNPPPDCMPYSCSPRACQPHTCMPGTGPCYPVGGRQTLADAEPAAASRR